MRRSAAITDFFAPRPAPSRHYVTGTSELPIDVEDGDSDDDNRADEGEGSKAVQFAERDHESNNKQARLMLDKASTECLDRDTRPLKASLAFVKRHRRRPKVKQRTLLNAIMDRHTEFLGSNMLVRENQIQLLNRWGICRGMACRPQALWLDASNRTDANGFHYDVTAYQTTASCLQFESSGQILASASDKSELSFYDFNEYRASARRMQLEADDFECWREHDFELSSLGESSLGPALVFKTPKPVGALQWNPLNEDQIAASSDERREITLYNVNTEMAGETFSVPPRIVSKGISVISFIGDRHLLIAGTVEGTINAWDTRHRQALAWSFQPSKSSKATSFVTTSDSRLLVSFANGLITELDLAAGVKKSQAFAAFATPQTKKETSLSRVFFPHRQGPVLTSQIGIQAMLRDSQHPSRVAVLGTNGARFNLDTRSWCIKDSFEDYADCQQQPGYHPNHRNCAAFSSNGSFLYSVRSCDERYVDIFDFNTSVKYGMPGGALPSESSVSADSSDDDLNTQWPTAREVGPEWARSCDNREMASSRPFPMDLKRKVSALTLHPDSDMLVVSHYRDPRIRVFGLV